MDRSNRSAGNPKFENFEVDLRSGELRKAGARIKLQEQPFKILAALLEHPGELVTREELRNRIWPNNSFGDFDHAVNIAVGKLRAALGDSVETPKYVETLPKRGYRFIGPVVALVEAETENIEQIPAKTSGVSRSAVVIGCTAVVVAGVLAYWMSHKRVKTAVAEVPALVQLPFTSYSGLETAPAFSPDGSRIAFAWNGKADGDTKIGFDLFVKAMGSETLVRLTEHPSEWISAAWSPDGTQIAFHRLAGVDTGIYVVPALGGAERKLTATHIPYSVAAPISWSPDGKWIAYADHLAKEASDRMFLISPETLETRVLPHNAKCLHEANLTFSHAGNRVAYVCVHSTRDFEFYVAPTPEGKAKAVTEFPNPPVGFSWSADDTRLIFAQAKDNGPELDEVDVATGAIRPLSFAFLPNWPTVAPLGSKMAYATNSLSADIWRRDLLDPEAPAEKLIASTQGQDAASYSPDRTQIAFNSGQGGYWEVWLAGADGKNPVQVSKLGSLTGNPRWSPDGEKLVFGWKKEDRSEVYIVDVVERVPRKLETNVSRISSPSWSRDGKWIYFRSFEEVGHKLYRCPAEGGNATPVAGNVDGIAPEESFDGTTLYYAEREANTVLRVASLDGQSGGKEIPGMPAVASSDLWTVTPKGIYFVPADKADSVWFYEFTAQKMRKVFVAGEIAGGLSVSRDGRYLLYSLSEGANSDIVLVENFH
jgi:Tol biopolymer transport system component/DNA-binding winged helix-turn-helix (wHTH) protein